MSPTNAYSQYQKLQVAGVTDQGEMVIMLYEGALKFLYHAEINLEKKDVESVNYNIKRAEKIIKELMSTLNMKAGEIAQNLLSLYVYMDKRLYEANAQKKVQGIKEVIELLNILKDTWILTIKKLKEENGKDKNMKESSTNTQQKKSKLKISC